MNKFITAALASLIATIGVTSCRPTASNGDVSRTKQEEKQLNAPAKFNRDSAYSYVRRQVTFGPRVAGTEENRKCREYIVNELQRHGAQNVNVQTGKVRAFNDDEFLIGNIMGSYRPELKDRILLVAHYDTRPWCDSDNNEENRLKPVIGANDGASGVATILEIARNLNAKEAPIGVDILFVDAEDYGQASGFSSHDSSWCLGTQYWIENIPYNADSLPRYAVLLDMVGGIGAKFHREYFSDRFAPDVVDHVWNIAAKSGYASHFPNQAGNPINDDHIPLNQVGIPTIDIIENKNPQTGSFNPTWHTMDDNINNIDPQTINAVGQTISNLIYNEK